MSPIPAETPLSFEFSDEFGEIYAELNFGLQQRRYLPPEFESFHLWTPESNAAISVFRKERGIGKVKPVDDPEQEVLVEEEGFEGLVGPFTAAAFEKNWCSQLALQPWMLDQFGEVTPNEKILYTVDNTHWGNRHITCRVNNLPRDFQSRRVDVEQAILEACEWWEQANLGLTFEIIPHDQPNTEALVEINFFQTAHDDAIDFTVASGKKFVLAHAFYPVAIEGGLASDIHFNDDPGIIWSLDSSTGVDGVDTFNLPTMVAHEIGHALGLRHIERLDSIMNPDYPGNKTSVDIDDLHALEDLYDPQGGHHPVVYDKVTGPGTGGPNAG